MDKISKDLFTFFFDLENIVKDEDYDNTSSLAIFRLNCQNYLLNQDYPNINIQDEEGNTFLHYVMESGKLSYCYQLLNLGSNPYIVNNKGINAFQVKKKYYNFISDFWKYYEKLSFHEFNKQALLYSPEFRQTVFDIVIDKQFIKMPFNKLEAYLNQIKLYSISNHVNLLFSAYRPEFIFDLFQQHFICQKDPLGHSLFLNKFYPLSFELSRNQEQLKCLHDYLQYTPFAFDDNIKKLLQPFDKETTLTTFNKENLTLLFINILNSSDKDLLIDFFNDKNSSLSQLFIYTHLQFSLENKNNKQRSKI